MKVLMFGWEFPPHILGGLGTASYGLTKGMSQQDESSSVTEEELQALLQELLTV